MNIPDDEIRQRLVRLSNLEKMYARAKTRIIFLEQENKQLKQRIKELEDQNKDQNTKIEALAFQFEQIKNKLFGKKSPVNLIIQKSAKKTRDIFSYQRPIPDHITKIKKHPIKVCVHCHGQLKKKAIRTFFEEDIPLPIQKIVIKHEVEIGYCLSCRRQSSGYPLPSKKAILGDKVKKYVCLLSIANRLSHAQIQSQLQDVFALALSIGEIGNILETEAGNLRPEYQALKDSLLAQTGVHYDETSWRVQKEEQGKFAWVATGTDNSNTVFALGRSRGKGNLTDLGLAKLGITDDYGAYKNSFAEHQLCWAHPHRKLRDLAESAEFEKEAKEQILRTHGQFSSLYRLIRKSLGAEISPYLKRKWQTVFSQVVESHSLDPTPLAKIKVSLKRNKQKYFTFLNYPNIPIDNNKAERALRHLVIKRRTSFGSKTQKGAETTSILASVILSLKWNEPKAWFANYLKLGTKKMA